MDVKCAIVVKYLTWIIFQLLPKPSSSTNGFEASLFIKKGYNISVFDLEKLVGYGCGSPDSGLYRDPNIDTARETHCPGAVRVCFPSCKYNVFQQILLAYPVGNLVTWIKKYVVPGNHVILLNVTGFDLVFNESSLTKAAVYNPGPPHVRPRIFAIPERLPAEPISNIFKAGTMTKFRELPHLEVGMIFGDTKCKKPTQFISKETCQEAIDEVKAQSLQKPKTTYQPLTSPETTTTVQPSSPQDPEPTATVHSLTTGDDGKTSSTTGVEKRTEEFSGSCWEKLQLDSKEHEATKVFSSEEPSAISCTIECQSRGHSFADFDKDTKLCSCYNSKPQAKGNLWKRVA